MNSVKYLIILIIICLLFGCESSPTPTAIYPKIISLAPSITEILFSLGLENNLVGVTTYCDWPAEARKIEKVATFSGWANIERILIIKPDIIFSTGLEQAPLIEKLRSLGFKVVLIYPKNLDELFLNILEIGDLTQKQVQAKNLVAQMKQKIERINKEVQNVDPEQKPKVFVEISADPLFTAGKGSFVDELITLAGGKNIAYDTTRPYSQFSPEIVIKRNPDYILLGYMQSSKNTSDASFSKRIGWQKVKAIQKGQVIADINPSLFLRPGPRLTEGLEQIYNRLYH